MSRDEKASFTGVEKTPAKLAIDERALHDYMASHVEGFAGPLEIAKFKGGQSNPTYLVTTPAKNYVLRRKPPGKLLPSAHAVDREYRIMTALGRVDFPVPRTYALCEDRDVLGTEFFIMDFVEGRIFWDSSLPEVSKEHRRAIFEAQVDTLAALHGVDYERIGLGDYGKPGNYFERQIGRWTKQYRGAETATIDAMDKLIDWLPGAIPDDEATSIVHGDFRFDNTIVDPASARVLAVLDWELSTLGHPLADFTYFLMMYRFPSSVRGGLADRDLDQLGIPGFDECVDRYCAKTGRTEIPDIDFCMAYNMFRIAAIIQGVYKRSLQGNASSIEAAKMGAQVEPLAQLAWSHAQKAAG